MADSHGGDDALKLKYVSAPGYIKSIPFGFHEYSPGLSTGYFFLPPYQNEPVHVHHLVIIAMSPAAVSTAMFGDVQGPSYCRRLGWNQIFYD